MSYINPVECGDVLSALAIIKKIIRQDADGNYHVGVHGLGDDNIILEDGDDLWKFGIDPEGDFKIWYWLGGWEEIFEL